MVPTKIVDARAFRYRRCTTYCLNKNCDESAVLKLCARNRPMKNMRACAGFASFFRCSLLFTVVDRGNFRQCQEPEAPALTNAPVMLQPLWGKSRLKLADNFSTIEGSGGTIGVLARDRKVCSWWTRAFPNLADKCRRRRDSTDFHRADSLRGGYARSMRITPAATRLWPNWARRFYRAGGVA